MTAILLSFLTLTGCASSSPGSATSTTTAVAAAPSPSAPTVTPASLVHVTLGVDGFTAMHDGEEAAYPFDDPEPLLAFIEDLTGVTRQGEDFQDPWGNGDVWGTTYAWDEIVVTVLTDGPANVTITSVTVGEATVATADGIGVGATRDTMVAAGGWED